MIKKELVVLPADEDEQKIRAKRIIEKTNLETDDWNSFLKKCSLLIKISKVEKRKTTYCDVNEVEMQSSLDLGTQ